MARAMLRLLISSIVFAVPAAARLAGRPKGHVLARKEAPPAAHVFVINLDERTDKCGCMSQQLLSSPYPVTRFPAVSGDTLYQHCPNFQNKRLGGHSANNTMALTCSNLLVWEAAVKLDTEYIIILEDDAILSSDVWARVEETLHGSCGGWDYIMVDSWHGNPNKPMPEFECSPKPDMQMYNLTVGYGGSHFQIWRRESLRPPIYQMRTEGYANPMDKLVHGLVVHSESCHHLRATAGFFNVSFQAGKRSFDPSQVPERCRVQTILRDDRPVAVEDGAVVEEPVQRASSAVEAAVSAATAGAFGCPPY